MDVENDASTRIPRLARALDQAKIDAFFAWSPVTMGYLHGFHEHAIERLMLLAIRSNGDVRFIGPSLSESQARRAGISDIQVWDDSADPLALVAQLRDDWSLDKARIAVDDELPALHLLRLQATLSGAEFIAGQSILGTLMRVKEPGELALMKQVAKIADEAWIEVMPRIRAGVTERQVANWFVSAMTDQGAEPYFSIVGAGPNGAEPHHLTDDTVLCHGDVVILDFGCDLNGYKSDITRTVAIGEASVKSQEVYRVVYQAHMAARRTINPGTSGAEIDLAARTVITEAGYGPQFFHRTGHGIGLRGHEDPYIVSTNQNPILPGNCFSIEPGIYLPGEFGVRIENIVTVTDNGYISLNDEPAPEILILDM